MTVPQTLEPGISRALARERAARVSNLEYELRFQLEQGATVVAGSVTARFDLSGAERDLAIDFAGQDLRITAVNSREPDPRSLRAAHDHHVLDASLLREGRNHLTATFASPVARTGTSLTVYHDEADGTEYYYTLLVPADAHRVFPCFDQPDLKARFTLELELPAAWSAVANAPLRETASAQESTLHSFHPTEPISTYLFAFACGDYAVLESESARLYHRRSHARHVKAQELFWLHERSLAWLAEYFATPYPFAKLDLVLVPSFPYGGMEHPGAIFYRESSLAFDHAPTSHELARRSSLVYHEVSHQWFGNLVTMEWFDDLWLKEGFATFMGYSALAALEPEQRAWLLFHHSVKPPAYRVDATRGTTPVYQELDNLAGAKSNYGAIVYNKAPALLRELEGRLGPEAFREGVRAFLASHAFGNARWRDLVAALEKASDQDLELWSRRWILTAGLPIVRASAKTDRHGRLESIELLQVDPGDPELWWPLRVDVTAAFEDRLEHESLDLADRTASLDRWRGRAAPRWILLNGSDRAYGIFLPDRASQAALLQETPDLPDPLLRATALTSLWQGVRHLELDPAKLFRCVLRLLETESSTVNWDACLAIAETLVLRYVAGDARHEAEEQLVGHLERELRGSPDAGRRTQCFRALVGFPGQERVVELCERLLQDPGSVPGLQLGIRDRYRALGPLLLSAPRSDQVDRILSALREEDPAAAPEQEYVLRALIPTVENKARYFESFLEQDHPPESWVSSALSFFHGPEQEALTLPYLERALEQLDRVKRHRKIFFMPAWIDGFVNGHRSREALDVVGEFLRREDIEPDVRLKLLSSADELERTVRIRERWSDR